MTTAVPSFTGLKVFRDIGGSVAADGRRVRRGQVFRCGDLSDLGDADFERLRALRMRLVCDLRSEAERRERPSRWPADLESEHLVADLIDVRSGQQDLRAMLLADPTPGGVQRMMIATYEALPATAAALLPQLLGRLADDGLPALIHCSAGKDRTGFICACIQGALGVPRDQIAHDYLAVREHLAIDAMATRIASRLQAVVGEGAARTMALALSDVRSDYLAAAFAVIDREHGSMQDYLRASGVTPDLEARLRERLLEPA